jgi:hypothetical protein
VKLLVYEAEKIDKINHGPLDMVNSAATGIGVQAAFSNSSCVGMAALWTENIQIIRLLQG